MSATIASIFIFLMAVTFHEVAHGWMANLLGDPTAKLCGRLTLNPLAHLDPIGSLLLPFFMIVMGSPVVFGWAKPVPVNFYNLRNPRQDMIWVSLAGPCANILLAIFFAFLLNLLDFLSPTSRLFLFTAVLVNLILAIFNMIPIPPLDGSRIISGLLSYRYAYYFSQLEPYGFLILCFLLWMGLFSGFILPLAMRIATSLCGGGYFWIQ